MKEWGFEVRSFKRIGLVLMVALVLALAMPLAVPGEVGATTTFISYVETSGALSNFNIGYPAAQYYVAQTFVTSATDYWSITGATLYVCKGGTPTGSIYVSIQDTTNTAPDYKPTGVDLVTASFSVSTVTKTWTSPFDWATCAQAVTVTFNAPLTVYKNHHYALVATNLASSSSNYILWMMNLNDGTKYNGDTDGLQWSVTPQTSSSYSGNSASNHEDIYFDVKGNVVLSGGDTTYTFYADNATAKQSWYSTESAVANWVDAMPGRPGQIQTTDNELWSGFTDLNGLMPGNSTWVVRDGVVGVNISSLPAGTIKSAKVSLYTDNMTNTGAWPTYYAIYQATVSTGSLGINDYQNAYLHGSSKLTTYVAYTSHSIGAWTDYVWDNTKYALITPDANGYIWLSIETFNQGAIQDPGEVWSSPFADLYCRIQFQGVGGGHSNVPKLTITMTNAPPVGTQSLDTNAATTTSAPNGVITSMLWRSPRLLYDNEIPDVDVVGTAGTPLTMKLLDVSGNALDTRVDSIRVDGHYYYQPTLPASYQGLIRVYESGKGFYSTWGYACTTATTTALNTMYALDTKGDAQFSYIIDKFMVTDTQSAMIVHFNNNIDAAVAAVYELRMYRLGLVADQCYGAAFSTLIGTSGYFQDSKSANNQWTINKRFAIFALSPTNTYDGLLLTLARSNGSSDMGFYQPVIYNTDLAYELTKSNSGWWYLGKASDGVVETLSVSGQVGALNISCGDMSRVVSNLNHVNVDIYKVGAVANSLGNTGGQLVGNSNNFSLVVPAVAGAYYARVTLSMVGTTFTYVRDLPFTVGGSVAVPGGADPASTTKDLLQRMKDTLASFGMDNPTGRYVALMLVMFLLFIIFHKDEKLRLILPLVALGLWILLGWVEMWLTALLALGAGVTIWQLVRHKAAGGRE